MDTQYISGKHSILRLNLLLGFALLTSVAQASIKNSDSVRSFRSFSPLLLAAIMLLTSASSAMAVSATQLAELEWYNKYDYLENYYGYSQSYPTNITDVNGIAFFTQYNQFSGTELWKSDGTEAGTVLVKDIYVGSYSSSPYELTNVNGTVFFTAKTTGEGYELWKSDGTEAGTVLVKDIEPGSGDSSPYHLTNVNGTLFFIASTSNEG
ncbi:MAG: hypothetical protein OQK69_04155, partial [Gammaproteobacteria bacterium]|nr:hypothetical protein [Gammaproteobacteria bacterium]